MGLEMLALLLLAVALAPDIAAFECGVANSEPTGSARIVNGQPQTFFKYPWFAALHKSAKLGQVLCAGALISSQFVMTVAHCFERAKVSPKDVFHVTLGIFNKCKDTPGAKTYKTSEVYIHPKFVQAKDFYDIALMKLDGVSKLMPVCLPPQGVPIEHVDNAHVAGFGQPSLYFPVQPCEINEATVKIYTNQECKEQSKFSDDLKNALAKTQIAFCGGRMEGGTGDCRHDSGGSILVKKENRYFSMGVASFRLGCADKGFPRIYTNLASYIDWINDTMRGELQIFHPMAELV